MKSHSKAANSIGIECITNWVTCLNTTPAWSENLIWKKKKKIHVLVQRKWVQSLNREPRSHMSDTVKWMCICFCFFFKLGGGMRKIQRDRKRSVCSRLKYTSETQQPNAIRVPDWILIWTKLLQRHFGAKPGKLRCVVIINCGSIGKNSYLDMHIKTFRSEVGWRAGIGGRQSKVTNFQLQDN